MAREYPNPLGTVMGFNFSSLLDMSRVTGKYMGVEDGDGEDKTRPHPASLSSLLTCTTFLHHLVFLELLQYIIHEIRLGPGPGPNSRTNHPL
ncbi:hypothetical protein MTR_4g078450 [Medicago truncatula]|uniref:Uncharacterized protein n=1 Tax=Medicago truncatula TaxID=3880 RepID=G7JTU7_MEDTR|nr:hypothetical protein MTR_4g078450 [Medicago truncatula]